MQCDYNVNTPFQRLVNFHLTISWEKTSSHGPSALAPFLGRFLTGGIPREYPGKYRPDYRPMSRYGGHIGDIQQVYARYTRASEGEGPERPIGGMR